MRLHHLFRTICHQILPLYVMKGWERELQNEFPPLKSYLQPVDRLARRFPGRNEFESYRIVQHRDGTIVGIDDEDYENRIELTRSEIVLYQFDLRRLRRESCEALGLSLIDTPLSDFPKTLLLGVWEPERSARFSVYLFLPGGLNLRDKIFEHIVTKEDFGEILLIPTNSRLDEGMDAIARKNNIILVPVDEVLGHENGKLVSTAHWGEYLTTFCRMVDVCLPSRYQKSVRDYVFARRNDDQWFLQYGETTSTLEAELLGPPLIQHLLKYPNQKIPAKQLWAEVMGFGQPKQKLDDETAEMSSIFSDGEEVIDSKSRENYRKRLLELSQERTEAEENIDYGTLEKINTEFEMIQNILKSSQGLGGRSQKIGSDVKKLSNRMGHLLLRTFKKIHKTNPNLAQYLKNSIECGIVFQYKPSGEITWKLE